MNLAAIRDEKEMKVGERVLYIFRDRKITNFELMRSSRKLASALQGLGVRRGGRVIVQMPNHPAVIESFMAVWRLGAVIVPINYLMPEEEISYIYRDSGACVVISVPEYLPKIDRCRAAAPDLQTVLLVGDVVPKGRLMYRALVDAAPELMEVAETTDDDNAALIYTAGTTGSSKGVIHTHGSLYMNSKMSFDSVAIPDNTISVSVLPLCHSFGIANMNTSLFRNMTVVLLPSFNIDDIFSSIEKYRAHSMSGVPTMYSFMLVYPEPKKYDLSSMRLWISGGGPLALETWQRFKDVYGFEITEGWGLTEAGANNTLNPIGEGKKPGSIGIPMKGSDMAIMDDGGRCLLTGAEGEVVIRGPHVMKGYWNKPGETAEALRDGWLHTGDMGLVDEDGFYWITGRKKDLIIKGGENISPRKIEEVLYRHPCVSEAAVVGKEDPVYGEEIGAFVVLKPGETATAGEIIDFCRGELTNFLLPKEVVFLDKFPRSLVGKILKKELRRMNK